MSFPAPIVLVDGQTYPVEIIYDPSVYTTLDRYIGDRKVRARGRSALAAALKVKQIEWRGVAGDILVFLPGQVALWTDELL